jgi:hypothetical protein
VADQITLGVSHEVTVGKYREKAWPKAEVSRTVREDETFEVALSETLAMLETAIVASIEQAVARIESHGS